MPTASTPNHFVVDGSNIATEGRSQPSLEQLNDAVLAFMEEHRGAAITVVVDATFGHRIAKKEVKSFDEAVANNELVTPPAGAIGRGDAFVLSIANKANAGILSNDSFQEFHGDYDWLFDEGRLIGGKPVPHVGWVFVARTPVRGPKSRQAVKTAKQGDQKEAKQKANQRVRAKRTSDDAPQEGAKRDDASSSKSAPKEPKRASGRSRRKRDEETTSDAGAAEAPSSSSTTTGPKEHVNELMPFLEFVENHPVGTSCTAQVESYASHGAYARTGDVLIYIPLRLMDEPAPRSARSALAIGEAIAVVVVGFTPDRRSIDAALPHMATDHVGAAPTPADIERELTEPSTTAAATKMSAKKATARRPAAKRTAAKKTAAKKAPVKKTAAKKAPAKKTAAKKAPAKRRAANKTAAKKSTAKKAPAKKAAATKSPAKKAPAKKSTARKAPAKKAAAKKAPAKKPASRSTSAKKGTG